jgi:hypothetical protein
MDKDANSELENIVYFSLMLVCFVGDFVVIAYFYKQTRKYMKDMGIAADNYTVATFVCLQASVVFRVLASTIYYSL